MRGRLGYAADRFMPFVTGGARLRRRPRLDPRLWSPPAAIVPAGPSAAASKRRSLRNWTAKVEYLYVDLGSFNCGLNCGAGLTTDNVSFKTNILRAGVNYKF